MHHFVVRCFPQQPAWTQVGLAYEVPSCTYFDHAAPRALVASHDHLPLRKSITHRGGCSLSKAAGMSVYQEAFACHCLLGKGFRVPFRKLYSTVEIPNVISKLLVWTRFRFLLSCLNKTPFANCTCCHIMASKIATTSDSGDSSNYQLLSQWNPPAFNAETLLLPFKSGHQWFLEVFFS